MTRASRSRATSTRPALETRRTRPSRIRTLLTALILVASRTAVGAQGGWVLWEHSYEVFVDAHKDPHRRNVSWKRVTVLAARADCDDRRVRTVDPIGAKGG